MDRTDDQFAQFRCRRFTYRVRGVNSVKRPCQRGVRDRDAPGPSRHFIPLNLRLNKFLPLLRRTKSAPTAPKPANPRARGASIYSDMRKSPSIRREPQSGLPFGDGPPARPHIAVCHRICILPRSLGPSVSPSRHIFQRLTNELSRNFPCIFGHAPVVFHFPGLPPLFTVFHPKRESPQPAPATALTNAPKNFFRLLSPSTLQHLRASVALVFTLDPLAPRSLGPIFFFRLLSPSKTRRRAQSEPTPQGVARATLDSRRCPEIAAPPMYGDSLRHRLRDGFRCGPTAPTSARQAPGLRSFEFRRFDVSTFRFFDVFTRHPNSRPPQALAQFPKPVCHYMSPSIFQLLRAANEAACRLAMADQKPPHRRVSPRPSRAATASPPTPAKGGSYR